MIKRKNIAACIVDPDGCCHLRDFMEFGRIASQDDLRAGLFRDALASIENGSTTTCNHGTTWVARNGYWCRLDTLTPTGPPRFEDFIAPPTVDDMRRWNPELLEGLA